MTNDTATENVQEKKLISKHQFYFDTPLYEVIQTHSLEPKVMGGDVDGYNSISHFDTTFGIGNMRIGDRYSDYYDFFTVTLTCKRNGKDKLTFFVYTNGEVILKLGQYPSLADIQFAELGKKYDKVLDEASLFEFKRAIGLAAHGTGIGSFVYLRRIFENLISQAFQNNKKALCLEDKDFNLKRMEDKVDILKTYLPSQLVEMKAVYSILSKGVHELSEDECLAYFKPLKLSIELILDQKIEMDIQQKRDQKVKEEILSIHQKLGK